MNQDTPPSRFPGPDEPGPFRHRIALSPPWRGAALGIAGAFLVVTAAAGFLFRSGYGAALDTGLGLLAGALGLAACTGGALALAELLRRLPYGFTIVAAGALGAAVALGILDGTVGLGIGWPDRVYYPVVLGLVALHGALGGALVILFSTGARHGGRSRAARTGAAAAAATVVIAADVAAAVWFAREGTVPASLVLEPPAAARAAPLDAPDPAARGPHSVRTLTYGSGRNRRRPRYAAQADLRTEPVDARPLLPAWKGFTARMRERYWGFGIERYPLNGTVWMPDGAGPFPLVLVVHGNHAMEEYSDPGYAYLGELLASRGFVTVSVDENLTNASWSGDFRGEELALRAWLLLEHLAQWRAWAGTPGTPVHGRVDMDRVALVGHSRGGEAAAVAAALNRLPYFPDDATVPLGTGFGIQAVVAIAPTDYRYHRRLSLTDVSYLTLHGSYDTDVETFDGMRQYQRVSFTGDAYRFKAALYLHRANHGQFNTVWGRADSPPPRSWLINRGPLISGEDQRDVAATFIAGFLEATLHGRREYVTMFRDPRTAAPWLPDIPILHRFEDSRFRPLATFEEDLDVTTGTRPGSRIRTSALAVWRERPLPFRNGDTQGNSAVALGWAASRSADSALYAIVLPPGDPGARADARDAVFTFSLSATDWEIPDSLRGAPADRARDAGGPPDIRLAVELVDARGAAARVPLADLATIPPPLHTPLLLKTKGLSDRMFGNTWEPILRTYAIPLAAFVRANPRFDPARLREARFAFARTRDAVVVLDDVGVGGSD